MGLALKLGRTLHELRQTLPQWEVPLWQAFYGLDPWDEGRADWRAAMLAHVNCMVNSGKNYKGELSDFLPEYGPTQEVRPWSDTVKVLTAWANQNNKLK